MFSLGIDPGADGALAAISEDRKDVRLFAFADRSLQEIHDELESWYLLRGIGSAILELVGSRPGQGVSTMFAFGKAFGRMEMLLTAFNLDYKLVTPQVWQRAMALGGFQTNRKKAHANKARLLFPQLKITQKTGDALLIAEYAWRKDNLRCPK